MKLKNIVSKVQKFQSFKASSVEIVQNLVTPLALEIPLQKTRTYGNFTWSPLSAVLDFFWNRLFQKPNRAGGRKGGGWLRIWNFQRYWRNSSKWNFQGLIKNNMEFPGVIKKKSCGISPEVLMVLGLKISEGCNTILWSF